MYHALRQLDDHTLRDLGFDRSEIRSVVAELAGEGGMHPYAYHLEVVIKRGNDESCHRGVRNHAIALPAADSTRRRRVTKETKWPSR